MNYMNAQIESTMLGTEDHGILSFYLYLDYGDGLHQGFGGYALDEYDPVLKTRISTEATGKIIKGIIEAVGVTSWEKLKGQYVRVAYEGEGFSRKVIGVGHIIKNKCFYIDSAWSKE